MKTYLLLLGTSLSLLLLALVNLTVPAQAAPARQVGTPTLPPLRAEAYEYVNVRAGPGPEFELVGGLIVGQSAAILGQTQSGQYLWLKITYTGGPENTGWVLKNYVTVIGESSNPIPTIVAPPTPTVGAIPVVNDPTLGAVEAGPTRLPTFTAPPPYVRPTLLSAQGVRSAGGFPPAVLIISLGVLGAFGGLISLLRRR